ncbi:MULTISPECIES: CDP-glycerol glycerophosphotransferase family protein [Bacillus]|uniref:CDP-glycerol:polyglycerol phosphate glycero-phosphotransferase n=1 Tax=Bacillus licheniformis (strain ATCC 14580 / DSM 13 / JCM 2505 / CCUG 7422 / NBRC 12200 / NCIMB 9375 / NCTC 10341 / NRRL NRS-1264 / Gibson 46) TaxID=279010 RepID=Q65E81_BACLD|nr:MULTISPECIES: CDP-glycerol glycerophosphotransferase family protein [Bacillus]AAU25260.1 CDP-glycerol:polyglycerol phosphate glycero-phosphotransferase [Bacillus licheniformis DSM 13 = ATCC 14580]AAU42633.1 CDP-glycerol:polyglycerol phosphate glycerophosphotransferase TagF [Bacillus licheniformis DSM 13 = ATCC 14580]MBG9698202.1 CDP-glycerol:glycerophosphate glycerophosphotransferase [Bacillus licheniformis]MCR3917665.1 CDP-glycerol glycerophosphotransferase family protein [Bacillus lichenif
MDSAIPIEFQLREIKINDARLYFVFESSISLNHVGILAVNRNSKKEMRVTCNKISDSGQLKAAEISLNNLSNLIIDETVIDFYVLYENNEKNQCKKRIYTASKPIELYWHQDRVKQFIYLPYTTRKGHFALDVSRRKAVAEPDSIKLSSEGKLMIRGYTFLLDAEECSIIKSRKLVLKEISQNDKERVFNFPLKGVQRVDLSADSSDHAVGFEAEIDLKKLYEENRMPAFFKFYIEYVGEDAATGEEIAIKSRAFKLIDDIESFSIVNTKKGPARFHIYPQKRKRGMRLRMNDYTIKTRAVYFAKGKGKRLMSVIRKGKNKAKKKISGMVKRAYYFTFGLAGKLPVKKKTVIFESFAGKQYSCNPRAIYEYMKEHHPEYNLIWSVNPSYTEIFEEKNVPYIHRFTLKWLFAMARAEYWVVNSRLPLWIPKPKHTTYVQTWHGTPLKRLAVDMEEVHMPGTNTEKYKQNFTKEASKWDYLISPNRYSTEIFARAFQFNKTMIESGYPRNDFLYTDNRPETMKAIKRKMNIPEDKKVILYAPTWRDDQFYKKGKYKFDLDLNLEKLREEIGDNYVIVLRMHYLVAENFDLSPYKGFAYDFSSYEDIRELYMVSDLLITDYSSVFFDFANLKRPMIFFVPDIETYRDKLRGFYFDFEQEAPGPLVKTTEEVIEKIKETETSDYRLPDIFEPFYEKFCYLETGNSTEKVVKTVFK